MPLLRLNNRPSSRDLRIFGELCALFAGAVAALAFRKSEWDLSLALAGVCVATTLLTLVMPTWLRPLYLVAIYVTYPIGFVVSHVVLAAMYYLVFFPTGVLLRLLGKDPLSRSLDKQRASFWESRTAQRQPASYFRQS